MKKIKNKNYDTIINEVEQKIQKNILQKRIISKKL